VPITSTDDGSAEPITLRSGAVAGEALPSVMSGRVAPVAGAGSASATAVPPGRSDRLLARRPVAASKRALRGVGRHDTDGLLAVTVLTASAMLRRTGGVAADGAVADGAVADGAVADGSVPECAGPWAVGGAAVGPGPPAPDDAEPVRDAPDDDAADDDAADDDAADDDAADDDAADDDAADDDAADDDVPAGGAEFGVAAGDGDGEFGDPKLGA
jgi:hypothetical protein